MLAVGSTLSVYPAASCVPIARAAGATIVIVNAEPTAMDHLADHVVARRGSPRSCRPWSEHRADGNTRPSW